MVIDLRALGIQNLGHLWILACRPYNNTGGTCLDTARRAPTLINNQLNENTLWTTVAIAILISRPLFVFSRAASRAVLGSARVW